MEVKGFVLKNGMEFIGQVENTTDGKFKIVNPVRMIPTEQGMGLMPLVVTAKDDNFVLQRDDLLTEPFELKPEIENGYREQFGMITKPSIQLLKG